MSVCYLLFFFFNDTATTEIYTLSLHDALPILRMARSTASCRLGCPDPKPTSDSPLASTTPLDVTCLTARQAKYSDVSSADRKSTRLNSSHSQISYAVFCLKKKKPRTNCYVETL